MHTRVTLGAVLCFTDLTLTRLWNGTQFFLCGTLAQFCPFSGYFRANFGVIPVPGPLVVLLPHPLFPWRIV